MITDFKFGITERGDAGLDLSWQNRLSSVIGAIIISKSDSEELEKALLKHKNKCIYHATCTGLGGTLLEPNVPPYRKKLDHIWRLIDQGFPKNQIIIRIDPLLPFSWIETLEKNLGVKDYILTLKTILQFAEDVGINSIRYSYLDFYAPTIKRLKGLPFKLKIPDSRDEDDHIKLYEFNKNLIYSACAEFKVPIEHRVGCISREDLQRLGIENKYLFTGNSLQRQYCLCPKQKLELLNKNYQCEHKCLYCYWKDKKGKNE